MYNYFSNAEIKRDLASQMPSVLSALGLHGGTIRGNEIRYNKKGSLAVSLSTGKWMSFEDGIGGDIFDLIMRMNHCNFLQARTWALSYLGKYNEGFSNE